MVAGGSVVVAIATGSLIVSESETEEAVALVWSVTVNTRLLVPGVVGTPETTPVVGSKLRPAGRVPEVRAQV